MQDYPELYLKCYYFVINTFDFTLVLHDCLQPAASACASASLILLIWLPAQLVDYDPPLPNDVWVDSEVRLAICCPHIIRRGSVSGQQLTLPRLMMYRVALRGWQEEGLANIVIHSFQLTNQIRNE